MQGAQSRFASLLAWDWRSVDNPPRPHQEMVYFRPIAAMETEVAKIDSRGEDG
jgi:hypothetical protein